MTASELRIGNKFYLPNGEVGIISYHEIRLMIVALDKPNYQPIPLTEEWLLTFGFKIDTKNFNWNAGIGVNEIGDFKLSLRYTESFGWFFKSRCTPIKYVHQLQNLYFALTGEELTFKQK